MPSPLAIGSETFTAEQIFCQQPCEVGQCYHPHLAPGELGMEGLSLSLQWLVLARAAHIHVRLQARF